MNRLILALLCLIPLASLSNADPVWHLSGWRAYTGFNVVNDIAVGGGRVWCGTDGGLLSYDKKTGHWVRYTIDDGLPAQFIKAVAAGPGRNPEIWFFALTLYGKAWVGRLSPHSRKVICTPFPYSRLPFWGMRLHLIVSKDQFRALCLSPPDHAKEFVCDIHLRRWREIQIPPKRRLELNHRYSFPWMVRPLKVVPSDGVYYLVGDGNVVMFNPYLDRTRVFTLPMAMGNSRDYRSFPFDLRPTPRGLELKVVLSRYISYPIGTTIFHRDLVSYLLDKDTGAVRQIGVKTITENEVNSISRMLEICYVLPENRINYNFASVSNVVFDGNDLWFAGDFPPLRYDPKHGRWIPYARTPNDIPLGQNTLVNFQVRGGALIAPTNGLFQYRYDSVKSRWIQEKRAPLTTRPRWLKVTLPDSPLPNAPSKVMWGLIAAETPHYRWITFGNGMISKIPGVPYAFCQAPARVNRRTGKIRFLHELWGWYVYRVVPYGHGDAWLMAQRVSMDWQAPAQRELFRYDARSDTLRTYAPSHFEMDEKPLLTQDSADLVATREGALFALTYQGIVPQDAQRFLMAWDAQSDQWHVIPMPQGWRLRKIFGGNGLLATLMVDSSAEYAYWIYDPRTLSLKRISIPSRYADFMPIDLHIGVKHLWFGGTYILRANR